MVIYFDKARNRITLDRELKRGGEGAVWTIQGQSGLVGKIYHPGKCPPEQKIAWMAANPPDDPMVRKTGHVSIAWPKTLLFDAMGQFAGFTMPKIGDAVVLFDVYNPKVRATKLPDFNWRYLHGTARNFASALSAIHAKGYVIGDINESNVLVGRDALVTLLDTDSFQVVANPGPNQTIFRCTVGKMEYIAPEIQGKTLATVDRTLETDRFGFGVLAFLLLMGGSHPFRSRWLGADDAPSMSDKIRQGLYPYDPAMQRKIAPAPGVPPLEHLHPEIVLLLKRCFIDGQTSPRLRPTAEQWEDGLEKAFDALIDCAHGHVYSGHLNACPWCPAVVPGMQTALPKVPMHTPSSSGGTPAAPRLSSPATPAASAAARRGIEGFFRGLTGRQTGVLGGALIAVPILLWILLSGGGGSSKGPGLSAASSLNPTRTSTATATVVEKPTAPPTATTLPPTATALALLGGGCWRPSQILAPLGSGVASYPQWSFPPSNVIGSSKSYTANLETPKGVISISLLAKDAPGAVNNFVCLARAGYFDQTNFFRIVPGSVLQAGDPSGTGSGGPGYHIADEPVVGEYTRGSVAMVNSGPNTDGSQFFVFVGDMSSKLPKRYTIFGTVAGGLDVIDAIAADPSVPVAITKVTIVETPAK